MGGAARGAYTLEELRDGGTEIRFQLEYLELPVAERLAAPLLRPVVKRALCKAIRRLGAELAPGGSPTTRTAAQTTERAAAP